MAPYPRHHVHECCVVVSTLRATWIKRDGAPIWLDDREDAPRSQYSPHFGKTSNGTLEMLHGAIRTYTIKKLIGEGQVLSFAPKHRGILVAAGIKQLVRIDGQLLVALYSDCMALWADTRREVLQIGTITAPHIEDRHTWLKLK